MKFRMTKDCPYDEKPNIGYKYNLIYIHSYDLAECIGSESTGQFYIIKDNQIVGSNKCGGILQNSIDNSSIPFLQLIHIGNLCVTKINKWTHGGGVFQYAIVGESELFDEPIYHGENIDIWNKYVNELINKFNWKNHLHS